MMCSNAFDLIGVGIGPFNLSLAAISEKNSKLKTYFFDQKPQFQWHSEIMFPDSDMQTAFLKDLVTGVDPTSPYSFLNYLVENGFFYAFMNTNRHVVTRKEFELYCRWVTKKMPEKLSFNSKIDFLDYDGQHFIIHHQKNTFKSKHLCIGTGIAPKIPEFTQSFISENFFHAKSVSLCGLNLEGKNLAIIGGGQTGIEVFRNALKGMWGNAQSVNLISSRPNLEPLDETPFTNEYFNPNYASNFFSIDADLKKKIVDYQKLSSDGNTPAYLQSLYNDLYYFQNIDQSNVHFRILPYRKLVEVDQIKTGYQLTLSNYFTQKKEYLNAEVVILCTGFNSNFPAFIDSLKHLIQFDQSNHLQVNKDFSIEWGGHPDNKIFIQNFSRYKHGIFEPQTSLMAWRSAVITNAISQEDIYQTTHFAPNFLTYEHIE